jgi:hypothetical protein
MDRDLENEVEPKVAREPNGRPFLITMLVASGVIFLVGMICQILQSLN